MNLEGLGFKLDCQSFDFIKNFTQIISKIQKFGKTKKYFTLCQNGIGTAV